MRLALWLIQSKADVGARQSGQPGEHDMFKLTTIVSKKTGSHPLEGEVFERAITEPFAAGALLVDATVADNAGTQVAFPTWQQQTFSAIVSGTAATLGGSGDLMFNISGDGYVTYITNVQLDNTTGPFTGTFNVYLRWDWNGITRYYAKLQLDNINNDAWTLTTSGLISLWGSNLKIYIAVDNVQDKFYWWSNDFQLAVTTTAFPAYVPIFPPPLVGQGGGPPPTFPPPTPPPIGAIPAGVLVGPAIQTAAPPNTVAGVTQPQFAFGSATAPPASAAFPEFTVTTYNPPIVFSNIQTDGVSPTTPPHTTTTAPITISGNWGPPIGPALPPVVPGGTRPFMMEAEAEPEEFFTPLTNDEPHDEPPHRPRRGRRRHV